MDELAVLEGDVEVERAEAGVLLPFGAQVHLDPLLLAVPLGDVGEPVGGEVAVELAVEDVQDVAVELGGHTGGVVVGGDEPGGVLHEVGAEEQPVPRRHLVGELARGTWPARPA